MRRKLPSRHQPILIGVGILIIVFAGYFLFDSSVSEHSEFIEADSPIPLDQIEDRIDGGVHLATGLLDGEGLNLVIAHCTACHSAKLITQNRADRDGWEKMIRWMQETQNLWELGTQEKVILDYLARYYAPEDPKGSANFRRAPLENIEWYELRD